MDLGTYSDGRPLTYDPGTQAFAVGGAPLTLQQVLHYDAAGQIRWVSAETAAWTRGLGSPSLPSDARSGPDVTGTTAPLDQEGGPPPHAATPPPFPTRQAPASPPPAAAAPVEQPTAVMPPPPAPHQPAGSGRPALSTGVIIGIVAAVLAVGVGGFAAWKVMSGNDEPAASASAGTAATNAPAAAPEDAATPVETAPATTGDTGSTTASDGGSEDDYQVVTEQEAAGVVDEFLTLRSEGDIQGSMALCSDNLFTDDVWAAMVTDEYWNPESWELTKFTPDEMYIHVTSMGQWPSGREPTIFQVFREYDSGRVLIDGFLDPEMFPELVTD